MCETSRPQDLAERPDAQQPARPSSATRSQSVSASERMWVEKKTVLPALR